MSSPFSTLRFSLFVALRYFFSRKGTAAVNVIAFISILGIALVAMAMVVVLSVFNGFERFTDGQLSTLSPDYLIESADGRVFDASSVSLPGVAPVLSSEVVASVEGTTTPVVLYGVDSSYLRAVAIEPAIFEGAWDIGDEEVPGIVLGIGVASDLGTGAGYAAPVTVTLPKRLGRISPVRPDWGFTSEAFYVGGVFRSDQKEDKTIGYIPIGTMRRLLQYTGDEVSALAYSPTPGATPKSIESHLSKGLVVKDRVAQHSEIYRVLRIEKWVSTLLLLFILLLSLFSVVSTLGMLIIEKREDSRTLSMLGAPPHVPGEIIILESWLLSVTGVTVGVLLGVLAVVIQDRTGFLKLGGTGSGFLLDSYPVELRVGDILLVICVILFIGWLSSRVAYALFRGRH